MRDSLSDLRRKPRFGRWPLTQPATIAETSIGRNWATSPCAIVNAPEAGAAAKSPPGASQVTRWPVSYQVAPSPVHVGGFSVPVPSSQLLVTGYAWRVIACWPTPFQCHRLSWALVTVAPAGTCGRSKSTTERKTLSVSEPTRSAPAAP